MEIIFYFGYEGSVTEIVTIVLGFGSILAGWRGFVVGREEVIFYWRAVH